MSKLKPTRKAFADFLQEPTLGAEQLSALHGRGKHSLKSSLGWRASAAAVVFSLSVFVASYSLYSINQSHALEQRIVREVLTNHLKIQPLDLSTDSMPKMQQHFDRLDFSPFVASLDDFNLLRLLGGRYCTLQGAIALQVRLAGPSGATATYYQARYQESLYGALPNIDDGQRPHVMYENGFELKIWRQKGVVGVLARRT